MKKVTLLLDQIKNINNNYSLSNQTLDKIKNELDTAKICIPIIGKFSVGKSAVLNSLLNDKRKILKEDITPETSIPTEVSFSKNERVKIYFEDETFLEKSIDEYLKFDFKNKQIKQIKIYLNNDFLEKVPNIIFVDMPGFESGSEAHNFIIDKYLFRSLTYILVFPADDMILRKSVANILEELALHNMSVCVVITKCDKVNMSFVKQNIQNLKNDLTKIIKKESIKFCFTSSLNSQVDEFKEYIEKLQIKSKQIIFKSFKTEILNQVLNTESYINSCIKNNELLGSELDVEIERFNKQIKEIYFKFEDEKDYFMQRLYIYVQEVKGDVMAELIEQEESFAIMLINKQNVSEQVNKIIRISLTKSIKTRVIPQIQKYMIKVSDYIKEDITSYIRINGETDFFDIDKISQKVLNAVVPSTSKEIYLMPSLKDIFNTINSSFAKLTNFAIGEMKREEKKNSIKEELNNNIFKEVVERIEKKLVKELGKYIFSIEDSINEKIKEKRYNIEKALADVKNRQQKEEEINKQLNEKLKTDAERIVKIKNELQ